MQPINTHESVSSHNFQPSHLHERYYVQSINTAEFLHNRRPRQPRPVSEDHGTQDLAFRAHYFSQNQPIFRQRTSEPEHKLNRTNSDLVPSEIKPQNENNNNNSEMRLNQRKYTTTGKRIKDLNKAYNNQNQSENRKSLGTNNNNGESRMTVSSKNQDNKDDPKMKELKEWALMQFSKIKERMIENEDKLKTWELKNEKEINLKLEWHQEKLNKLHFNVDQKIKRIEQKIERVQEKLHKNQNSGGFTYQQTQQLNRILTLVQKVGNHEEHKKTSKMIEQLRQNILELHMTVNQLTSKKNPTSLNHIVKENNFDHELKDLREKMQDSKKEMVEKQQMNSLIKKIQQKFEELKKGCLNPPTLLNRQIVSHRKCLGPTITLTLREEGTSSFQETGSHTNEQRQPHKAILSECLYYIDSQGYLLDSNKFYLLNQQQEQIQLSETEINLLKTHSLM